MTKEKIKDLREKTLATPDKIYNTRVYQYYIDASGHLCRVRRKDLDTISMYSPDAVEILD